MKTTYDTFGGCAFEEWWHLYQGESMSHSKYLARKAFIAGLNRGAEEGLDEHGRSMGGDD